MPSWQGLSATQTGSIILKVEHSEKDEVKRLGAQWDLTAKKWFLPPRLAAQATSTFHRWLPEIAAIRNRCPGDYMETEHPDRVYLCTFDKRAVQPTAGLGWDPVFPKGGALFVTPEHTHDLEPWRRWLPADIDAGGAATAESDGDTALVYPPEYPDVPPFTMQWTYFWADGALMRRRRRWAHRERASEHRGPFVELMTQWEYNRRVDDSDWPNYKHDDAYDMVDESVPEWHGGGTYIDLPDFIIDRKKQSSGSYGGYCDGLCEPWDFYMPPAMVEKKRGQYRDVDEIVVPATGTVAETGPKKGAGAAKKGTGKKKAGSRGGDAKVAKKGVKRGRDGAATAAQDAAGSDACAAPAQKHAAAAPTEASAHPAEVCARDAAPTQEVADAAHTGASGEFAEAGCAASTAQQDSAAMHAETYASVSMAM